MKNIEKGRKIKVIFYSGYRADEHPSKIVIDDKEYEIEKSIPLGLYKNPDGSESRKFLVITEKGERYVILQTGEESRLLENYGH